MSELNKAIASSKDAASKAVGTETVVEASPSDIKAATAAAIAYEKSKEYTQGMADDISGKFDRKVGTYFSRVIVSGEVTPGPVTVYLRQVDNDWIAIGDATTEASYSKMKSVYGLSDEFLAP